MHGKFCEIHDSFFRLFYLNYFSYSDLCNHTGCVRDRDRDRIQNNERQYVSAPVRVQVQCERFYIKLYNPSIHVLVLVHVPETASVNKSQGLRKKILDKCMYNHTGLLKVLYHKLVTLDTVQT